jgi:hypothetical protein
LDKAGHKASKTEAVKTQKRKDKFDEQVSIRLSERHLLELSEAEVDGAGGLWQYFENKHTKVPDNRVTGEYTIEGAQLKVFEDKNGTLQLRDVTRKSTGNKPMLVEGSFRQFCIGLTGILDNHLTNFSIRITLKGKGVIFRSSLSYHGRIWRDWVMVDWGDDGVLPNKIYGFLDCRELPRNFRLNYGGLDYVDPGIYRVRVRARVSDKVLVRISGVNNGCSGCFIMGTEFSIYLLSIPILIMHPKNFFAFARLHYCIQNTVHVCLLQLKGCIIDRTILRLIIWIKDIRHHLNLDCNDKTTIPVLPSLVISKGREC